MKEVSGDFWGLAEQDGVDAIVCTLNTVLKKDGTLVMGAGIAQQFAERMAWLPDRWGIRTKLMVERYHSKTYPFVERDEGRHIVGIHTKLDWKEPSPLWLIERSIKQLYIIANSLDWKSILMTKPGCGYGSLSWERQVRPLIKDVLADERFVVVDY